jgi:hypothetical protein
MSQLAASIVATIDGLQRSNLGVFKGEMTKREFIYHFETIMATGVPLVSQSISMRVSAIR